MDRKTAILLLLCFAVTGSLYGQLSTNGTLSDFYRDFTNNQLTRGPEEKSPVAGSPYESEDFVAGEIITKSALHYSGIPLRYNIYSDQMEFKNEDDEIFAVGLPENVDTIMIGTRKFIYCSFKFGSKPRSGYLQVLTEGNPSLLKRISIFLKPAEPAQGYKDPVPAGFERTQDEYYLSFISGEVMKISGKKDLMETLPGYQTEMEQFIKTNKIKFSKAEDLIKLINYYSSLEN